MAQYSYKARRRSGELVQDVLEAADRNDAVARLQRSGLVPISVDVGKGGAKAERNNTRSPAAAGARSSSARSLFGRRRKPKLQELATFTQQLTNLLKAGMPLTGALNSMSSLGSKGIPPEVSKVLRQDVMEGKSLSDAMSRQPNIFSELHVNMVRAGEQSGALVEVLQRLASHYERFAEVRSKFVSALIYPAVVSSVGIVIVFFFMTKMLPKFTAIFTEMKTELPGSTKLLINISHFFAYYWWVLLLLALAAGIIFFRYKATEAGGRAVDRLKLRLPVLGNIFQLNLFAQFARTLGTLLHNGVPVLTALKITEQVVPNRIVREAIARTREEVTDGKTIAQPLARSRLFPQLMIDLIRIGEETGDVPGALNNVAQTYENELSVALRVMTNLIEPVMIIAMAIGVGFLLFSVLSAMFQITANIAR